MTAADLTKFKIPQQMSLAFPPSQIRAERQVEVACSYCSRTIRLPQWYVSRGLKLHFCDEECLKRWRSEIKGDLICLDGRPDYKGGDWEVQARRARERDGYTCQICNITEKDLGKQLDVHHILPFRLFRSNLEANRLGNLISVCHSCHMKLEAESSHSLPLFARAKGSSESK